MKTSKIFMVLLCVVGGFTLLFSQPVMAAKTVNIDVNAGKSSPGNITPDVNGVNVTYVYGIYSGDSIVDHIPVEVCMTGSETGWTSIGVTFGTVAGGLNGITLPGNQTFLASATVPDCRNLTIDINTGPLSAGNYDGNISLSDTGKNPSTGANQPNVAFQDVKNFHIRVEVLEAPGVSNISCFLTDSKGLFLTDCNGASVTDSGSDDGRFQIVPNKKGIQVATNPGQFYFNLFWLNTTGSDQTVDVNFERTGVVPHGAQAIHSAVFNEYLSTVDPTDFDETNSNGIPDGTDDEALGIFVPAGSSLFVTYHLEWADIQDPMPAGIALTCQDANQLIEVTGTVSGTDIDEECTSSAYGYKK